MRPCRACFTALHDECWDDAGVCPTLGCATWMRRIRILPRQIVASSWLLGAALGGFGVAAALLVRVIPAFAKMFTETCVPLSAPTQVVIGLSSSAGSPL